MALAREGRPEDAYRLLLAHFGQLRGYLHACYGCELGGSEGIEELLHDAAWKAVEKARTYRPERGGLLFWAWQIGAHLAMDQMRSDRARRSRERRVARSARSVREAIDSLPDPFRTILHFDLDHHGRGPADQLAARLGVKVQTIYNWRNLARAMLRPLFQ